MRTERTKFAMSLALAASILLSSVTLFAQDLKGSTPGDWSRLNAIETGSKVTVKLKDGKTVAGKLSGVSDTLLSVRVKDKVVDLKRPDILSVYQKIKKSAGKATLIGLGAGAAAGAVLGAVGGDDADDGWVFVSKKQAAAGLSVLGAGIGAMTGFLIGRGKSKRVLIYQATQP
jgi:hypothetical protein